VSMAPCNLLDIKGGCRFSKFVIRKCQFMLDDNLCGRCQFMCERYIENADVRKKMAIH
jgi:hypothetical protein